MNRASGIIAGARPIEDGEIITHGETLLDDIDREVNRLGRTLTTAQREHFGGYGEAFLSATLALLRTQIDGS